MKKRYGPEQIVAKLRQADVKLGKGLKVSEVCKQLGITVQTYYRWRQKYGGMALPAGGPWASLRDDQSFQFVVIGDTHHASEAIRGQFQEINCLGPDLVIHLGDLTVDGRPEEWDAWDRMANELAVPLVMIPGNHDIYDPASRQCYEGRYGKTFFSFNHKGVHFIALDSETLGEDGRPIGRIDQAQLDWLRRDLENSNGAPARFVFVHRPFWLEHGWPREVRQHWMQEAHPLLAEYGVNAVFAGHIHRFVKIPPIDGVHYYVTFSADSKLLGHDAAFGNFHHASLVTVCGGAWKVAVLRPGLVAPDTVVQLAHPHSCKILDSIKASMVDLGAGTHGAPFEVQVDNPSDETLHIAAQAIQSDFSRWRLTPEIQTVTAAPRQVAPIAFWAVLTDPDRPYPNPRIRIMIDGLERARLHTMVTVPVGAARRARCRKTVSPPRPDGRLDDPVWMDCQMLGPLFTSDGAQRARFATEARLAYDENNLYLALRCEEPELSGLVAQVKDKGGEVWKDDSIEIIFAQELERWCQLIFNAHAVMFHTSSHAEVDPIDGCVARAGREIDAWTLQISIPWRTIGLKAVQAGTEIGLQIVRNRAQTPAVCSQWAPTLGKNCRPACFGRLCLE